MGVGLWTRIASFFGKRSVARLRTAHHPFLEVTVLNGRVRLEGETVHHTGGSLHAILAEAMRALRVDDRDPRRVLLLGLGGGSAVRILRHELDVRAPITAVEVDPAVIRLAREVFGLARVKGLEIVERDAWDFVHEDRALYDLVVVDVFVDRTVPERLRGPEFLAALKARLAPTGLVLFNLIADDPRSRAEAQRTRDHFRATFPLACDLAIRTNLVLAGGFDPAAGER